MEDGKEAGELMDGFFHTSFIYKLSERKAPL